MKHRILPIALAALFLTGPPKAISAQPLINYQGRVAVGTPAVNFNGTGQFKFALVDATGNVTFWSNDGSSVGGSQPAASVPLTVTKGLYSVLLGDTPLMNPLLGPSIFTQPDLRLRVWFSDNTPTGFQLLSPDQRLAPTAYLADGVVSSANIAPGAVNSANIAAGAIRTEHFFPGSLDFSILQTSNSAAPGLVLGFNGGTMVWTAPGAGDGIWTPDASGNVYRFTGNVGIGTASLAHRLAIGAGASWTSELWSGSVELTNGGAIAWDRNAAGWRFGLGHSTSGGGFFRTASGLGTTGSPPIYDLFINDAGNVGIGTTNPLSRLEIAGGQDALGITGFGPVVTFRDTGNGNARSVIQSVAGDINFFTESYMNGSNPYALLKLANNGNVGIGSSQPNATLDIVSAQNALLMTGFGPFLTFQDTSSGFAKSRIQAIGGTLIFQTASYIAAGGGNHYARLDNDGNFTVRMLTIRGGADLAEPFQMKEDELEKGSVVVIDDEHPGRLKRSRSAYDTRVAGIISGANGVNPGIALHQEGVMEGGQNVALTGRVYVQADASSGPIKPGDLLTTSDIPGHAMKVTDHAKAQGAVIGKAMSSLNEGTGMVLVLVTLQ